MKNTTLLLLLAVFFSTCGTADPDIPGGQSSFKNDKLPSCTVEVIDKAATYARLRIKIEHQKNTSLDSIHFCYCLSGASSEKVIPRKDFYTLAGTEDEMEVVIPELKPNTAYQYRLYVGNKYVNTYTEPVTLTTKNGQWKKIGEMPNDLTGKRVVKIKDRVFVVTEYIFADEYPYNKPTPKHNEIWEFMPQTAKWKFVTQSPFLGRRDCAYFGIEDKIYMGMGLRLREDGQIYDQFSEWWCYDTTLDKWSQKRDYTKIGNNQMNFFSYGNKGYILITSSIYNQMHLYEYNPIDDSWVEKASFPGLRVFSASFFAVGGDMFVCTGMHDKYNEETNSYTVEYVDDTWKYDVKTNQWHRRADFPGGGREQMFAGICVDNKGFAGSGFGLNNDERNTVNDWWCYIPELDKWIRYPDPPDFPNFVFELDKKMYFAGNSMGICVYVEN